MRGLGAIGILACAAGLSTISMGSAMAGTYTETVTPNNVLATYCKHYILETDLVNTRGILVQRGSVGWVTTVTPVGEVWERVRTPPVYIQTRRVLEPDHYSLVPGPCP